MRFETLALPLLLLTLPTAAAQWSAQAVPTSNELNDVWAVSPTEVYVVGDGGVLLRSTDGGGSWAMQTLGEDLEGIAFNGSGVGIAVDDDGVSYRTTDGVSWAPVATGAGDLRGVAFGSETVVFAAGRDGDGARSLDGGLTWAAFSTGASERTEAVAAVGMAFWAVGREGEIRFSADAGQTWSAQASGTAEDLKSIQMLDAQTGYIGGSSDTVLKTTNGGQTWTNVSNGNVGEGVGFVDVDRGWAVDDGGRIYHTPDGGATWQQQASGTTNELSRVHFADAGHGWAVGDFGTVVAFRAAVGTEAGSPAPPRPGLEVFPQPAARVAHVRVAGAPGAVVSVHDALGRTVLVRTLGTGAEQALELDTSALPPGLYVVRLEAGAQRVTRRLVVVR